MAKNKKTDNRLIICFVSIRLGLKAISIYGYLLP
jgi:hypothetical protein